MKISKNKNISKLNQSIIDLTIIIFTYFCTLRFIFPKYFMPLVGHHSDMIDYAYDSLGMGILDYINVPRPIGQIVISFFSFGNYHVTTAATIGITILNIFLVMKIGENIFEVKNNKTIIKIVYLILIFAHPAFYINYTFDIYSTIGLTFFLILIYRYYNRNDSMLSNTILIVLSGLSKETYLVSIIIFFAFNGLFIDKKKRDKWMVLISSFLTVGIILWNKNIGSAFVALDTNTTSAYYASFNIKTIIRTLLYYIKGWGNIVTVIMFLLILVINYKNKKILLNSIMLIGMSLAAYLPYSVLPNHVVPHYRWLGIVFGYLIIFAVPNIEYKNIKPKNLNRIVTIFTVAILYVNMAYTYQEYNWAVEPEQIQGNILKGFDYVKDNISPKDKVLITGLYKSEETLYKAQYYIKDKIPYDCDIQVLTTRDTELGNHVKLINLKEIKLEDIITYDKIFIYNLDGKIKQYINVNEKNTEIDTEEFYEIIWPEISKYYQQELSLEQMLELGNIYNNLGNSKLSLTTFNYAIEMTEGLNAYPYFYIGNIYEEGNQFQKANEYYKKAASLEENKYFDEAINRTETKLLDK